jgi:plastocyanin
MKVPFLPVAALVVALVIPPPAGVAAQHVVSASGFTFSPPTLNAFVGDTVVFSLSVLHDAVQVAESTWNVNGDLPLPGGFAVPFGGGSVILADTGTHFYICEAHIASGMKGKIVVAIPPPPTTTIIVASLADRDGLTGTPGDRIAKKWSLTLYQDSVGSGIVLGSVASGTTLSVPGLPAGTYAAAAADSASWSHVAVLVNGAAQPSSAQNNWSLTVPAGGTYTIGFLHTAPNMVISSGLAFDPDSLTVDAGDTVFFVLAPEHSPREVSKATWLAGGTASNGGFDLPAGGGYHVAAAGGVDYYVCVAHAGSGSKGLIFVNPIPPSSVTLGSVADADGNHATTGDRVPKPWSLKLYRDSVGSGVVVDSAASGSALLVTGLPPGAYVAVEADSAPWTHVSYIADGASQGATPQSSWAFSVGSGESRTVEFINTVPNMIISSGFSFVPETLTVDSGETVWFVLDAAHTARQVDSAAWQANDTVSNGGFDLPSGGGSINAVQPGRNYYVCVPHASGGMKGVLVVHVEPYQGSLTDSVTTGWNLLSVPFLATDTSVAALYPGAVSQAFVYAGGYAPLSAVANGPGYWIKFGTGQEVGYSGLLVASDTVPVAQGWNIVGSVSSAIAAPSILTVPPGIVTSAFYGYAGGYVAADTIFPGRGYWVKVSSPGSLIVGPGAGAAPAAGPPDH